MTKKRRMPVNILAEQPAAPETASVLDDLVAGQAEPRLDESATEGTPAAAAEPLQPTSARPALQQAEFSEARRLRRAEEAVLTRVLVAAALGLLPWPLLTLVALTALHMETTRTLAEQYGAPLSRDAAMGALTGLLAAVLAVVVGGAAAVVLKLLPLVGPLLGAAARVAAAAAATYALGQLLLRNCEAGGTLLVPDPRAMLEYFRKRFGGSSGGR